MALKRELQRLEEVDGTVPLYAFGLTYIKAKPGRSRVGTWTRTLLLEVLFTLLSRNLGSVPYQEYGVPMDAFVELGSVHQL